MIQSLLIIYQREKLSRTCKIGTRSPLSPSGVYQIKSASGRGHNIEWENIGGPPALWGLKILSIHTFHMYKNCILTHFGAPSLMAPPDLWKSAGARAPVPHLARSPLIRIIFISLSLSRFGSVLTQRS